MYTDLTIGNKSLLKRFSHGKRFRIALDLLNPATEDRILDFGTGDGFMLSMVRAANNHCVLTGYEPFRYMFEELRKKVDASDLESVEILDSLEGYENTFNKICCLEVLEHLTERNQRKELKRMKSLLDQNGKLIVSVPIEVGLSSMFKNLTRILLRQSHKNTSLRTLVFSLFGIHFDRGDGSYISSHMGFYYHDLEKIFIASGFRVRQKKFSPVPMLKGVINSQVFFVLENN